MADVSVKLTVLFDEPFWVGLYERETDGRYEVARIVFGAEPKDYEVQAWLLANACVLRFSPSLESAKRISNERINPKRRQREAARQLENIGVGTRAQQALSLLREQSAVQRREKTKELREAEAERQFQLRQQKRREKHRGH